MKAWTLLLSLACVLPARADERYDHKGALGLLVAVSGERKDSATLKSGGDHGWRTGLELGVTFPIGEDGNELKAALRGLFGGIEPGCSSNGSCAPIDLGLYLGYRGYFSIAGSGQWKTFYDIDLAQHVVPHFVTANNGTQIYVFGPRVGLGIQLDFLPIAGTYFLIEGQIGFGDGLRYGAGMLLGVQLRSYLFE